MTYTISRLILLGVLLVLSAFFSGSETAIFSLSNIEKRRLKKRHPYVWTTISNLLESPRRTLITILIGNMVVNTMATALATLIAYHLFGPPGVAWVIPIFTITILITSELTPKVFAVRHNELFAFFSAIPLDLFARFCYPVRWIVRGVADRVLSFLIHERKSDTDLVSGQELKALARIGKEEGALRHQEGEMIQKLLGLGDRIVREIMVPRTDIVAVDFEEGPEKLVEVIKQHHFTYVPVYKGSIDNLLGTVSTQKFMLSDQKELRRLIEPPHYVPETKPIDELLQDFERLKRPFAVCVDEHGGTAGIVTMEDVLEEIFGEFYDEYAKAEPLVKSLGDDRFLVHGKIGLHELKDQLGVSLTSEVSETLSGWLLEQFGEIPKIYDVVKWQGSEFYVRDVFRNRIIKVEIRRKS